MLEFVRTLVDAREFIPHGHCYLWKPELVWLHVVADVVTGIAYYSISFLLVYFVHKRRDLPFNWIFLIFGSFIVACGTTHFFEVWTLWHPTYWLSGLIKAITAWVSVGTAVLLVPLIPQALALPSPAQLEVINLELRNEITQRQEAEKALQRVNEQLEIRVQERTAELATTNESLQAEIEWRKRQEEVLNRREQEFKALVENAPDIITRFDRDLRHLYINPAITRATGLLPETFIGKTNRDLGMPEDLIVSWENSVYQVFETGQEKSLEFQFPTPNGLKYYQVRLVPELGNDGAIKSTLSIARDISEHKQVEEALLRRSRQLEILSRASHEINTVLEIPTVMRTMMASAIELAGASAGTYGLNKQGQMVFSEYNQNGKIYSVDITYERGMGVSGWVMETRKPYVSNQAESDPNVLPYLQKAFTFYNLINIPIFNRKGELIGCFELHNKAKQRPFSDNDITMLQGLAASAAVALENAQMLVERQQAEKALRESEQRLAAIFNQAAVGIAQVGLDGKWLLVNQKLCDIVGYTSQELLQQTFQDITHPDDLSISLKYLQQMSAGEIQDYSLEKRYVGKNSLSIWINLTASVVRDLSGKSHYFIVIVEDISERKTTEEERQKLVSLIENSSDFISLASMTGEVLYVSEAGKQLIGLDNNEEVKTTFILDYLMEEDRVEYLDQIVPALMKNGRWEGEYRFRNFKTNQPIVVHHNCFLIADSRTNEAIAIATVTRDITERKRAEQEIRELNHNLERRVAERTAELEAINQELESFSYSVSHDLRAPLRGIDGFSQALLDRYADRFDEKGKHYLQRIRTGTQRMGELIDDLLKLSRVTRSEMHRTQVDLSALAREIAAELQRTQPERQVEWAIAPGRVAYGDARLLRIVLENLLNNSWKFTSARMLARIEFDTKLHEDAKPVYFVHDNGAGFEMAYANKLFGAFQRLHTQAQFPGTGIGLATVQRIIHRHGGRVWAEAAVEQGATFYFTL
ncbi:PAS domain S-box protein [Allocoleopsis franciscana]|uniref:histidine kinase n=1 Tax=Allocoleopsis franciscana PCC 7113 TaxID=1173027 RepID=K9WP37_9CYAN|nr:PAS domain S-box protein [Allocoleopsis franciscana]AFZ21312.1 PAS domain S-box [Allocoleopsis franciscana PCC 7113]